MNTTNYQSPSFLNHRFLWLYLLIGLALGSILFNGSSARAQESDELWGSPINLSQSGAASEPQMVIDANGNTHVLWREDAVNSLFYALKRDGRWFRPAALELPFATLLYAEDLVIDENTRTPLYDPQLVADSDGRIHAFWLDDKGRLYHSSVAADEFDNFESWSERQTLGESVLGFNAISDEENHVHLGYVVNVDSVEAPAGVYYRRAEQQEGGVSWSEPATLYMSAYFRSMKAEDVNVRLARGLSAGNESSVYVAFDNRPLEEVLFVRSGNGGVSWQAPSIIDQRLPDDAVSAEGPSNIDLTATGKDLQIAWKAGRDAQCQLYHQRSEDDGRTWKPAYIIETRDSSCPSDLRLLSGGEDLQFLLSETNGGAALQAWNGVEWSKQEKQEILTSFVDPITHRPVSLGCQQASVGQDDKLMVIGCGSNEGNNDVWLLERPLGNEAEWFSSEPATWSEPSSLMDSDGHMSDPLLLSGSDNLLHAFWISEAAESLPDAGAKIYYSSWNDDTWSRQIPLLMLETEQADQLAGVYEPGSGPFLLWRDVETNTYLCSSVMSERILLPAEWSSPAPMFDSELLVSHPAPYFDRNGAINVVYAVPLNEGRGIYLMRSQDRGKSWSEPIRVVDAVAASWDMVDRPSISQTANGDLHVVFTVYALEPEPAAIELYYTRSGNGGEFWSEPELIAEGEITWSEAAGADAQTALLVWQQRDDDLLQFWSQQSVVGEQGWERPVLVLDPGAPPSAHALITQIPDQPYLLQMQADLDGNLTLQERRWSDDAWRAVESHDLETRLDDESLLDLAAAVAENGQLITLYNTQLTAKGGQAEESRFTVVRPLDSRGSDGSRLAGGEVVSTLYFTDRAVDLPAPIAAVAPAAQTDPVESPVTEPVTEPEPASAPDTVDEAANPVFDLGELSGAGETNSTFNIMLLAVAPAILIIVFVLALGIIRLRPGR